MDDLPTYEHSFDVIHKITLVKVRTVEAFHNGDHFLDFYSVDLKEGQQSEWIPDREPSIVVQTPFNV